ncbi:MarR family winged helix-turn-helix transcriptional regulator [Aureibacter tunicatorum]|uniref:DNA-binding MarR family transcriptional regulator n=1 Tax=Aureibacter tunicatorum TaxID=866807 RepID=A0AAE3XIS9_9BACT|nr:MarR family transcriptional regulator [Aureibacter tunicatorum]MDR6237172.1 DNA-binding MarR family transcriptional regulator [Aureibacter tunicatorum]BDD06164.1 MarR family transcriptional regulator [Aureibacter tunicatorum]
MKKFKTGELLGKSSRLLSNKLTQGLTKHQIELTPEQWMVLEVLVNEPKSQKEICEITLKNKASINSLVSNLIKTGLVSKSVSESDKRNNVISITDLGIQIKKASNQVASETLDIALEGLSSKDIETLNGYLLKIKNNLIK